MPFVANIRLPLFIARPVRLLDRREPVALIEGPRLGILLEGPKLQMRVAHLCDIQQCRSGTTALTARQNVQLIDPILPERDDADEKLLLPRTPDLTPREDDVAEIGVIFVRCV